MSVNPYINIKVVILKFMGDKSEYKPVPIDINFIIAHLIYRTWKNFAQPFGRTPTFELRPQTARKFEKDDGIGTITTALP